MKLIVLVAALLTSCAAVDDFMATDITPAGAEQTIQVADVVADSADSIATTAGTILGAATGNPMLAGGATAMIAALLASLAARRKKKSA